MSELAGFRADHLRPTEGPPDRAYLFPSQTEAGRVLGFEVPDDFDALNTAIGVGLWEQDEIKAWVAEHDGTGIFAQVTRLRGGPESPILVFVRPKVPALLVSVQLRRPSILAVAGLDAVAVRAHSVMVSWSGGNRVTGVEGVKVLGDLGGGGRVVLAISKKRGTNLPETVHELLVTANHPWTGEQLAEWSLTDAVVEHRTDEKVVLSGRLAGPAGRMLEAEPAPPTPLEAAAAELAAADRDERKARERWEAAVTALMDQFGVGSDDGGLTTEDETNEAVLQAFEELDIEPFESLSVVICRRARIAREHAE